MLACKANQGDLDNVAGMKANKQDFARVLSVVTVLSRQLKNVVVLMVEEAKQSLQGHDSQLAREHKRKQLVM